MRKSIRIRNDIQALPSVSDFLEEVGDEMGLPPTLLMSLNLVVEEAVSNVIFYAYEKGTEVMDAVRLSVERLGEDLIVCVEDHGSAFDPTAQQDPDITLCAEERPVGGLGIFLIKKLMDEVSYERREGKNLFIMKKRITG